LILREAENEPCLETPTIGGVSRASGRPGANRAARSGEESGGRRSL